MPPAPQERSIRGEKDAYHSEIQPMSTWRLLDTGVLTAAENIAIDEVLLEEKARGNSPDTIRFLQFFPPAVLVGYSQSVEQEVRLDYCRDEKIHINRRITGGGAIFLDETQVGWEIVCDRSFFDYGIANSDFFSRLSQPIIHALGKLGIDAAFRPRNDIEVKGRKISGTGGTEEGKAFFFQGTLLVDFDAERMFRALRVPVEKLKTREIETAKDRVTCLQWELGRSLRLEELKSLLKESFEEVFAITLVEGELTQREREAIMRKKPHFESREHIDRVKRPEESQPLLHSIYKARGGLIRCGAAVNLFPAGRLRRVLLPGISSPTPGE